MLSGEYGQAKKKYKFGDGIRHVKKKIKEKKEIKKQRKLDGKSFDLSRIESKNEGNQKNLFSDDDKFQGNTILDELNDDQNYGESNLNKSQLDIPAGNGNKSLNVSQIVGEY